MRSRRPSLLALVFAAALPIGACGNPIAPDGAVRFAPPAIYRTWWGEAADCAGLERTSFENIGWYVIPGVWTFDDPVREGTQDYGLWVGGRNTRIYLAENVSGIQRHVKHEMMHALLRTGGHPATVFGPRCGL